ncbi:MAG: DNA-formamidopyrimidine glycosylase [Geitlerinemataceae cyanobacterium]
MPELPEVETVRRGLEAKTLGYAIEGGEVLLDRTVAYPETSAAFLGGLAGATFRQWRRRGKYLLSDLDRADGTRCGLGVHLRMTGQLLWCNRADPLQKHTRVRLFLTRDDDTTRELRFVDTRTFGQMWWIPPQVAEPTIVTGLQKLGPEPLSAKFTTEAFAAALAGRKRPIKTALLDQAIVAGVGNIYADEALFLSGIRSTTLCKDLSRDRIDKLRHNVVRVLEDSIALGGTTFSDFTGVTGTNGRYGGVARVYNRSGDPCHDCGTTIERIRLAGRSAHFCPKCQPET